LTPAEKVLEFIDVCSGELVARCFPETRLETQANLLHTRKWFSFNMLGFLKESLINCFDKKRLNNPKLGNYKQLQNARTVMQTNGHIAFLISRVFRGQQ